jgi:hypothetical protein
LTVLLRLPVAAECTELLQIPSEGAFESGLCERYRKRACFWESLSRITPSLPGQHDLQHWRGRKRNGLFAAKNGDFPSTFHFSLHLRRLALTISNTIDTSYNTYISSQEALHLRSGSPLRVRPPHRYSIHPHSRWLLNYPPRSSV